ncbi:MAG: RagB/SusD family nutrient uptake outer membrane protein [Gemmatimonadaceae bacterium]
MNLNLRHRVLGGATAFATALVLYGCHDFLTQNAVPQGAVTAGTLKTQSGVEGTLIAAYRALDCNYQTSAWGCAVSNWVFGSVASDDAYEGSQAGDQPGIEQIELYHWTAPDAEGYLDAKWQAVYDGVARANATLRLLRDVEAIPTAISAADAKGIRGEAIFLRAHYHFEAYRMWGNIPYYRANDTTDYRKANETKAQVEADLLVDLDSAIALLDVTPRNSQAGRATRWTAKAYKGRVQMYAGNYAAAITTFNDVKNNGPYALETSFDHVWTGFKQFENGKETIFAYQASANDGNGDGENSNFGERLNFPSSGSPFGCCGFHQPSYNLVNYFQVDAAGLPLALSNAAGWNANNNNFTGAQNTVAVDPRLDWTAGRDNVPFKDWGLHGGGWVRSIQHGGPYSAKKNVHENASGAQSNVGWTNTQLNSVNIHIFRYADLLLMLAEAEAQAGTIANAQAIVNQIRSRAAQTVQGCGVPTDAKASAAEIAAYPTCGTDPTIKGMAVATGAPTALVAPITKLMPWATYKIGPYTGTWNQAQALAAIQAERRLELAMEGQRFFDLRRWGIAQTVLNGYVNGIGGGAEKTRLQQFTSAEAVTAKHNLYPIPDQQIQLSKTSGKSNLAQNPGW